MKHPIKSKKAYHETMVAIYDLMNKGESSLTESELTKLAMMTNAAEDYEDNVLGLKPSVKPESITAVIEQKMFESKMNQASLAVLLGLSKSKLSEILNGKRKPDVPFLKAVYEKLHVDPAFLLEHV